MNRLVRARSPYLRQHATNPVDWYPWGEDALARARELDRPLLVSVGYAACHWCHVMAHECFEDPAIAELMNAQFVCVKVDREQSPEIDAVCMDACLALNGHGGWPLNVFFTPEQQPFFAGTYFPPADRPGMPGFATVLGAIAEAWHTRPDELRTQGTRLSEAIATAVTLPARTEIELPREVIAHAATALTQTFDEHSGGWGPAPLFPAHCTIDFLLNVAATHPDAQVASVARDSALRSLTAMASGGIYDQLGGGFHRYSVDGHWTVPHFEKMLYDNALLARAYLHGWQLSGEPRLLEVATATLDFAIRELQGPEGGFCSSLDADSEGGEGAFYVWTPAQIKAAIDDQELAALALAHFGVTDSGNFDGGASVLTARATASRQPTTLTAEPALSADRPAPTARQLDEIRARLLATRANRPRPARDDKRLTGWNALILMALADAGAVLGREDYLHAATNCARFLLTELRGPDGKLRRSWLEGQAELPAQLDDYAYLLQALIVLYEATFDTRHYEAAIETAEQLLALFAASDGGFFTTTADQPTLISRRKDAQDAPIPSGNAAATLGLLRLAQLTGETRYEQQAVSVLAMLGEMAARQPSGFAHTLSALDLYLAPAKQVALIGDHGAGPLASAYRQRLRPHCVLAGTAALTGTADDPVTLLRERTTIDRQPTAYVCQNFTCRLPVTDVHEFVAELDG